MAVMLGFHREKRVDATTPFYLCELRIRLFDRIFCYDKFLSTYLGRPPRISYRHCAMQSPLDLNDDEVCLEEPDLTAALSRLEGGWSTLGHTNRSSWRRVSSQQATICEDILEISLGLYHEDLDGRIRQVRLKIESAREQLPAFVRVNPEEILSNLHHSPACMIPDRNVEWRPLDVIMLLMIHCGFRHTDFLLERAIVNRLRPSRTHFIVCARSLLDIVLKGLSKREYLRDFQADIVALDKLAFYALPSASFLAIELLRSDQTGNYDDALPRSKTVQQLSTLISAFETVSPEEGNHRTCEVGRIAIQQVLDRLLSPHRPQQTPDMTANSGVMLGCDTSFPHNNDADALQWLGNLDFDASDWASFLQASEPFS
ncbi:hypothetical protein LTR08_002758 [Meristemomyces frigidus]|nr:hypothetical protein LTR08_002758 [Meristemomyces frigidus]